MAASGEMRLATLVVPVADVDRAKAFYRAAGFREDLDHSSADDFRVVRFTPPGSSTSILFGTGMTGAPPGSAQGLILAVEDVKAASAALVARGIEVGDVFHDVGGVYFHCSPAYEVPGPDPARRDHRSFARFSDPDGNGWLLEEVRARAGAP